MRERIPRKLTPEEKDALALEICDFLIKHWVSDWTIYANGKKYNDEWGVKRQPSFSVEDIFDPDWKEGIEAFGDNDEDILAMVFERGLLSGGTYPLDEHSADFVIHFKSEFNRILNKYGIEALEGVESLFCHYLRYEKIFEESDVTLHSTYFGEKYGGKKRTVTIPNGFTTIGERAFAYTYQTASIILPDSLTSIGDEAFYECKDLEEIVIPCKVKHIGRRAFAGCEKLRKITILSPDLDILGGKHEEYGSYENFNPDVFEGCRELEYIHVDPGNREFCDISGVLFKKLNSEWDEEKHNKPHTLLFAPPEGTDGCVVPKGVRIREGAFDELFIDKGIEFNGEVYYDGSDEQPYSKKPTENEAEISVLSRSDFRIRFPKGLSVEWMKKKYEETGLSECHFLFDEAYGYVYVANRFEVIKEKFEHGKKNDRGSYFFDSERMDEYMILYKEKISCFDTITGQRVYRLELKDGVITECP